MSDKTSQRTEEEMLDQTFVGYDEEMTVQTEDGGKDAGAAKPTEAPAKKKNQNLLVYGAMGVAAVGFLGYKFLGGSNNAQPAPTQEPMQQSAPQQPQQTAQTPVAVVSPPVAAVTTDPVSVPTPPAITPVAAAVTPAASAPVDPVAQYTGDTSNATLPKVEAPVTPVVPVVPVTPVAVVKPEVKTESHLMPAVVATNAEATSSNEKLLAQFQDMLDKKYDPKFDKIQKSLDDQKDFNKSIEDRLSRLEAGKSTKVVASKLGSNSESSESSSVEPKVVKKIVRKPIIIKHRVETSVHTHSMKNDEGDVLIDRSSMKMKPEIEKIEPVYPKIEIHSVYSGRIWTKNADGTLSTFAVGDKLPTGEVIKKIDEEKERVTTDKRVISQ